MTSSERPAGGPGPARLIAQPLDRFMASAAPAEGVRLADLAPYDVLEVRTRNTCYLISTIGLRDARVLVMGGTFFALPCEAQLVGSTLGGSAVGVLRFDWSFSELPRVGLAGIVLSR